ncbi:hypothetical protein ACO22_04440 [Paracoccidioides brasiliensis]|uniref:Homeobox domain-containing protein n=1 Tax=Paracoccidioides brasiliensis TaxID=121759 RepID=A0A1D2JD26_PARBR|nr:hypothetical protein ACO22_04440 [Paracoccidioides brasiliensis]
MNNPEQSSPPEGAKSSTMPSGNATNNNYPFLVHSQKTLTQNLPPRVNNKALARQKRRRTSPDDQKILEAEYHRNPKPNRAKRAEIVNRVTLGEKEVQIWFQNRRQNDRRRSTPLHPEDFRPSKCSTSDQDANNNDNTATSGGPSTQLSRPGQETANQLGNVPREWISPQSSFRSGTGSDCGGTLDSSQMRASQITNVSQRGELNDQVVSPEEQPGVYKEGPVIPTNEPCHIPSANRKRSRSEPQAPNANSKSEHSPPTSSTFIPPSLRISLSFDGEAVVRKEGEITPSPQKPRDSIRISMSADGEALIRGANEESPTKGHSSLLNFTRPALGGLRRSISAFPLGSLRTTNDQRDPKPFGRSRDSRNWELHCDTDARTALLGSKNSLSSLASRTGKLARRKSDLGQPRALMQRTNLPNTLPPSREPRGKRKKLPRAMSSVACLESGYKSLPSKTGDGSLEYHFGDSDKENWIPATQISASRRSPSSQRTRRGVLQNPRVNNEKGSSQSVNGSNKMQTSYRGQHPNSTRGGEGGGIEELCRGPDDVSQLISGPNQDEDLDCIQGLLSLSQGAWK